MADDVFEGLNETEDREPAPGGMLLKDAATIVAALALFGGAGTWAADSGLALALVTAVGAALAAGWIITSVLHEWGHYAGAKLAGAIAPRVKLPGLAFFRFNFDLEKNSVGQFASMSAGGNLAHWGAVAAALLLVPMETLAQSAFVSSTVAFAVFASFIEWPIIARTLSGRVRPAKAFAHLDRSFLRRNYVIGGIGGLLFFTFA